MNYGYPMNPSSPFGNGLYNPYLTQIPNYQPAVQPAAPHREIDRVNGKDGALAFPLGPNSSVVLVDINQPKIWLVTTDSAGFKTVHSGSVTMDEEEPIQEQPQPEPDPRDQKLDALMERLEKLEERMRNNGQPDSGNSEPVKSTRTNGWAASRNESISGTYASPAGNVRAE